MSESESRRADSSSSGLSSRSTSSTARNSSNLDSNGSTSTGSVEKSKIRKSKSAVIHSRLGHGGRCVCHSRAERLACFVPESKLKSWFKKRFTLKATRKPTARASDHRDSKKASESSVTPWRFQRHVNHINNSCSVGHVICFFFFVIIILLYQTGLEDNSVCNLSLEKVKFGKGLSTSPFFGIAKKVFGFLHGRH